MLPIAKLANFMILIMSLLHSGVYGTPLTSEKSKHDIRSDCIFRVFKIEGRIFLTKPEI